MKTGYVNNEYINNKKFKLRKIAITLGLASAILISINVKNKDIDDIKEKFVTETNMDGLDDFEISIINSLKDYENSYKNYENDPSIENRIDLVSQTRYLSKIADTLIEGKINESMGTSFDVNIQNIDGGERIIKVDDSVLDANIPYGFNQLVNDKDFVDHVYQGDGSNSAWDDQMKDFNKEGLELYESILKNLDKDYILDNNKFKEIKEENKVR